MMGEGELPDLSLRQAQLDVDASIVDLGGYWPPLANLARLFEECGELARAINQTHGGKRVKPDEAPATASDELGDVLYVLLVLANSLHLDAASALDTALRNARARAADMTRQGRQAPERGTGHVPA